MLTFNYERTIKLECELKGGQWVVVSLDADKEIRSFFKRNGGFLPEIGEIIHAKAFVGKTAKFLGKYHLDDSVYDVQGSDKYMAIITLKKRDRFTHPG